MADCLPENYRVEETGLCTALAVCLIHNRAEGLVYNSREEVIRSFVQSIPALQKKAETEKEEVMRKIKEELKITPAEERLPAAEQEESAGYLLTGSAGLCLISPWFPRLFDMLGYLCEDKKAFKDTASKIRAVFLLQYLACPEEKKYRETELAFNRLLVALPMHIPLPERLPLTDDEKQTAESMLEGVKANWKQMSGTSVAGFRQSFIARSGTLEEQDEKWMLTVNEQAFDILLDTVPWSFRQIRFSWLKKYVEVVWRERQEF